MRAAAGAGLAAALALACGPASAGEWTFSPSISVNETYSDNIELAPSGAEEHDFVTTVTPGLNIRGQGRRAQADVFYRAQAIRRARAEDSSDFNHQLQAGGLAELIEDLIFVDASATVRQENTSDTGVTASDNLTVSSNRDTVVTYRVSPHLKRRLGDFADGELRYTHDEVDNGDQGIGSQGDEIGLVVTSGDDFQRLPWTLSANRREEENDNGAETTFQRIEVAGRYEITRRYGLVAAVGYEDNDFATGESDTSGITWRAGATWTPTPRTEAEFGIEERFFDQAFFLNARHRSRRTVFQVSYREDVTTTTGLQLERQLVPLVDAFGQPVVNPDTGAAFLVPLDTPTQTDEVLVTRRLSGSVAFQGRRTNASLSFFDEERDFSVGGDESVQGLSGSATRRLSRKLSASLSGGWQQSELRGVDGDETRWNVAVGLSRRFTSELTGSVDVSHTEQDADVAASEYEENRVFLGLTMAF
jgi:uncharacterized protein (PEP-CTERM system associated)